MLSAGVGILNKAAIGRFEKKRKNIHAPKTRGLCGVQGAGGWQIITSGNQRRRVRGTRSVSARLPAIAARSERELLARRDSGVLPALKPGLVPVAHFY